MSIDLRKLLAALTSVNESIAADKAELAPFIEGLQDYSRLDLVTDSQMEVKAQHEALVMRRELLTQMEGANARLIDSINALIADGYPKIDMRGVKPEVLADLQDQQKTIAAALSLFAVSATDVAVSVSGPRPTPQ